jgi:hypothetical protein
MSLGWGYRQGIRAQVERIASTQYANELANASVAGAPESGAVPTRVRTDALNGASLALIGGADLTGAQLASPNPTLSARQHGSHNKHVVPRGVHYLFLLA